MSLIEQYFHLTGRPIATMTVAEYLEFCEYENAHGQCTEHIGIIKPNDDFKTSGLNKDLKPTEDSTSTSVQTKNNKKQSQQDILKLLQSVSG